MKVVIFTSNALRHRFVANSLTAGLDETLVVVETKPSDAVDETTMGRSLTPIERHFRARYDAERRFFAEHLVFQSPTFPIRYGEVNLKSTIGVVRDFRPEAAFVFGAAIIKPPLIELIPQGRFINLHLGLSPYYRGSGTNFWPFVNEELQYVGATVHHLDAGIDTGSIISHATPDFAPDDDVHTVGCKVIVAATKVLGEVREMFSAGEEVPGEPQWGVKDPRYYRNADFDEAALARYTEGVEAGLIARYLSNPPPGPRLVSLKRPR